jgi:type II secretory pathway pseudopilin PulG
MRNAKLPLISLIASLLIIAAAAVALLIGLSGYTDSYSDKQVSEVRDTVMSYVAQCYALEGAYPPDLNYLADNYGLQLDTEHYTYFYDLYASNIMPDVRVFEKGGG